VADEANEPLGAPGSGTPTRRLSASESATASALLRIDPHLAGLFERGLTLADETDEPGVRYLVAHVGRELSRAVISALTGETLVASRRDVDESEMGERFRRKVAAALNLPETDPHVAGWFRSHQALVAGAHWRRSPPSEGEIRSSFTALVGLLFGRIAPYFDTQAELDRLLQIAAPAPADVERLTRCTSRYTQRQYFFNRLAAPGWLRPLAQVGLFRNPPDRKVDEDGSWSIQSWPEGEALARLAAGAPEVAVTEFLALPMNNTNPAVWKSVAAAALALQPADASRLVPLLIHALMNAPPVLFPESVVHVIRMLAGAGDRDAAFRLTEALLFVKGTERNRAVGTGHEEGR
jgi:hypothetical protein